MMSQESTARDARQDGAKLLAVWLLKLKEVGRDQGPWNSFKDSSRKDQPSYYQALYPKVSLTHPAAPQAGDQAFHIRSRGVIPYSSYHTNQKF